MPQLLRPALWFQLSGGAALQASKPAGHYESLAEDASPKSVVVSRVELEAFNAFPSHSLLPSIKGLSAVRRLVVAHNLHTGSANFDGGIVRWVGGEGRGGWQLQVEISLGGERGQLAACTGA